MWAHVRSVARKLRAGVQNLLLGDGIGHLVTPLVGARLDGASPCVSRTLRGLPAVRPPPHQPADVRDARRWRRLTSQRWRCRQSRACPRSTRCPRGCHHLPLSHRRGVIHSGWLGSNRRSPPPPPVQARLVESAAHGGLRAPRQLGQLPDRAAPRRTARHRTRPAARAAPGSGASRQCRQTREHLRTGRAG